MRPSVFDDAVIDITEIAWRDYVKEFKDKVLEHCGNRYQELNKVENKLEVYKIKDEMASFFKGNIHKNIMKSLEIRCWQ